MGIIDVKLSTRLYVQHRQQLVRFSQLIVGCPFIAEEVVQDVFIRFAGSDLPQEINSPIAYLRVMVRNRSHDVVRRNMREANAYRHYVDRADEDSDERLNIDPEFAANLRSEFRLIERTLDTLSPQTQKAILLYFFDDLSFKQVAEKMGVSIGKAHALVTAGIAACDSQIQGILGDDA